MGKNGFQMEMLVFNINSLTIHKNGVLYVKRAGIKKIIWKYKRPVVW